MTIRSFAATDGAKTVFRASATCTHAAATMDVAFSAKAAWVGYFPAEEITRAEYQTLVDGEAPAHQQQRALGKLAANEVTA